MKIQIGTVLRVREHIYCSVFWPGDLLLVTGISKHETNPPPLSGAVLWDVERIKLGPGTRRWCTQCLQNVSLTDVMTPDEQCVLCGYHIHRSMVARKLMDPRAKALVNLHLSITPYCEIETP